MNTRQLNDNVRALALKHNFCQKFRDEWSEDKNPTELMDMFFRGLDFYLKTRFLSAEQIQNWFSKEDRWRNNIFANEKRSALNPERAIAVGSSIITIRCNSYTVSDIYATNESVLRLKLSGHAYAHVTLLDDAKIDMIETDGESQLYICRAGANTFVAENTSKCGRVNVVDNYNLYKK